MRELFKIANNLSPPIMDNFFYYNWQLLRFKETFKNF